jgi:hypothetical protein
MAGHGYGGLAASLITGQIAGANASYGYTSWSNYDSTARYGYYFGGGGGSTGRSSNNIPGRGAAGAIIVWIPLTYY